MPGAAEEVETPALVIAGWITLSAAIVPLATGIILGAVTLNQSEAFHSRVQVDPQLQQIKSAWLFTSVGADVNVVVGVAMIATGAVLLLNGYSEQAALQDVMEPGR